jgi:exonuclease III
LRIDHLLLSPALATRLADAQVDANIGLGEDERPRACLG